MSSVAVQGSRSFGFEGAAALRQGEPPPASLDLTSSDGVGLVLVSLSARAVLVGPLAFTELHLVFQNPEPRQLEGRFRIGLPGGASISRFAMRIGTQWQEGEVVERQAARRAYEDFLHRRQDPALLEHEAGNEFSARVFPIEAHSQKEIILSYSHELTGPSDPYRLPLKGLPQVQSLDIRALVGSAGASQGATSSLGGTAQSFQVVEVKKTSWKPDVDFEVTPASSGAVGLRHENLAVMRVLPDLPTVPDEIPSLLVLLDTSASRALGHDRQVEIVAQLCRALARGAGAKTPLAIACFDQAVEIIFEGDAGDFQASHAQAILSRMALGASDLAGALAWAAARKNASQERLLLVTDGVATAGDTEAEKIAAVAKTLSSAGVKRLDVLAVGGLRDDAALRRLVTCGLERDGTVCDGDLPPREIAARLTAATRSGIQVQVPGASWVWPARLDGVQPGDAALVYADLPPDLELRVLLDDKPAGGEAMSVERPLLERAWVKARIERLEDMRARPDTDADVRAGLQKQIIDLSVKHRVLSPYTALLVLETEADYERFHIDRRALSDILTVGLSGVEVLRRTAESLPISPPAKAEPSPSFQMRAKKKAPPRREAPEDSRTRAGTLSLDHDEGGESMPSPAFEPPGEATLVARSQVADGSALMDLLEQDIPEAAPEVDAMRAPRPAMGAPRAMAAPRPQSAAPMGAAAPPSAEPPSPAPMQERESASPLRRLANAATDFVSRVTSRGGAEPPPPPPPAAMAPPPPPPMPGRSGLVAARPAAPGPAAAAAAPAAPEPSPLESYSGKFREVMELILAGKGAPALDSALTWRQASPGDVLALVAIGEAAELTGNYALAARAYGSLIDLFPSRADLRRFAGERLSRLTASSAQNLAIDTYRKAVESRPDHPSSHRLLGMALLRAGRPAEAFEAIAAGQARSYPDKFPGIPRILSEDLALTAAAWMRAEPNREQEIRGRLSRAGANLEDKPSVRFVLVWETDANDVDFHIHDAHGGHAYFREKILPSGGELYADVTQGYGPECFTIRGTPESRAYPYKLQAHYYRQGPMGFGMGALQIIEHDGKGHFTFDERPYVVMKDGAYLDLGVVNGPLPIPV